ncbi:FAD binding domain-containing protein [Petrocella sp. FN5]|uniref:FAD binding domain-containing protein n=1 Tax=Petrocella sp. FN5 TaxID=3032002 RepID=UPI0023DCBE69|nr:FAD binding domain-containing protein [Petrocella sp. FN5]MDF1616066.1 FAD binding domain-containing protein [Petrocella sp. FN5]
MVNTYYPTSYEEALELLNTHKPTIIAGGTDLMVRKRAWSDLPTGFDQDVLFVGQLEELNYIDRQGTNIHIGAGVTLEDIMDHFHTPTLLSDAIKIMASPAIRHRATLAGNVVNASPAGDTLPVLYVLDSVVVLESLDGIRHVPIDSFIKGPGKTIINHNEMIKEIILSGHKFNHSVYRKVGGRKADAISKLSVCMIMDIKKGIIQNFRAAFGAVGPTVVRDLAIESKLIGKSLAWLDENVEEIGKYYESIIKPIDDQRSSATYRKACTINLLTDFIKHIKHHA